MVTEAPNADRDATIESFLEALSAPLEDEPESQVLRMELDPAGAKHARLPAITLWRRAGMEILDGLAPQ